MSCNICSQVDTLHCSVEVRARLPDMASFHREIVSSFWHFRADEARQETNSLRFGGSEFEVFKV